MDDESIAIAVEPRKKKKLRFKPCTVEGCTNRLQARGLCVKHYNRFYASGQFTRADRIVGAPEERFHLSYAVNSETGCWEWTATRHPKGYAWLSMPGDKQVRGHRFSWELYRGPIPEGMKVLHRCDNRPCVNPDHLFLGTTRDNSLDMAAKGRFWCQPGVDPTKLNWPKFTQIRILFARGEISIEKIAWLYGLDAETIRSVLKGRSWLNPPG